MCFASRVDCPDILCDLLPDGSIGVASANEWKMSSAAVWVCASIQECLAEGFAQCSLLFYFLAFFCDEVLNFVRNRGERVVESPLGVVVADYFFLVRFDTFLPSGRDQVHEDVH